MQDEFYASPVAAGGYVIFASRAGRFHVVKAGDPAPMLDAALATPDIFQVKL